jgi:hypothetical protein
MIARKVAGVVFATASTTAFALDWELDDGTKINWTNSVSYGQAARAANRDSRLLNPVNANLQGISGGVGGNTDDSDLNYSKGQVFSTLLNLDSEVRVSKSTWGGVLGLRAWKDFTLDDSSVAHGNQANGYQANTPLSDSGFEPFARFSNAALMNAYVYNTWQTGAGDAKVTFGRQVLNWGNDMFIQNINQVNAINFNALHGPGTGVNDWRLPQGMLVGRFSWADRNYVEGFYQFQFQNNVFDGCGTYFGASDGSIGPSGASACAGGYLQSKAPLGDTTALANGAYIPGGTNRLPGNGGQYGISAHYALDALSTNIGVYAMNINSRTPNLGAVRGNSPFVSTTPLLGASGVQSQLFWDYAPDVHVFGVSTDSKVAGWNVGSGLSYTPNFPVQLAAGDLLGGLIYSSNPAILKALLVAQGLPAGAAGPIAALMNANAGPLGSLFNSTPLGGSINGYNLIHKTQLQFNVARGFPDFGGAQLLTLAGEFGMQWDGVPSNTDGVRYGRAFVFGVANSPAYNLPAYTGLPGPLGAAGSAVTQAGTCPVLNTAGQPGCTSAGFVTPFSMGLRLRAQLTYANVFHSAVTLKPTLYVAPDLRGYSADGQFNAGRVTTNVSLLAEIGKQWQANLSYVTYNRSAAWDQFRDRDYVSASVRYTF